MPLNINSQITDYTLIIQQTFHINSPTICTKHNYKMNKPSEDFKNNYLFSFIVCVYLFTTDRNKCQNSTDLNRRSKFVRIRKS